MNVLGLIPARGGSKKIIEILENLDFSKIIKKNFYDIF